MSISNFLPRLYFFLHIPKTAGVSFTNTLQVAFPSNSICKIESKDYLGYLSTRQSLENWDKSEKDTLSLICGHYSYGLHTAFPNRDFNYLTFLRDPVKRTISLYFYIKQQPTHPLYHLIVDQNLSLRDFAIGNIHPEIENCQTKMLSGQEETDFLIGTKPCSEIDLERAIKHIEAHFPVVGLTEKFDQSIHLINCVHKLSLPPGIKRNVTKVRSKSSEIDQDTLKAIQEVNAYDIELYHYCVERFEKMLKSRKIQLFFLPAFSKTKQKISAILQKKL